jgi:S1 RNA binding domain/Zc3h12a-like Ribonuclease NYN domain
MTNSYKVVVDGSNIATEGRTLPSLSQLDEAVTSFIEEHPGADVLVIVDSSFPNRIDPKEVPVFESAYQAGEIIMPPAGTIGRGDAFILKVADKLAATILSNDSFQEFHGTYDWLFDKGRLIGGKPLPGIGWVYMPRTPVRGVKSREAVREAKRSTARIGSPEAMQPMPIPKAPPTFMAKEADPVERASKNRDDVRDRDGRRSKRRKRRGRVGGETETQNDESSESSSVSEGRTKPDGRVRDERTRNDSPDRKDRSDRNERSANRRNEDRGPQPAINEPLTFINFIAAHLIGSEVEGIVESYSSHGFYVEAAGARAYVPLAGLAVPMPRSAKEVVRRGDALQFVVTSFDSTRRGIELALVGSPAAEKDFVAEVPRSKAKSEKPKSGRGRNGKREKVLHDEPVDAASVSDLKPVAPKDAKGKGKGKPKTEKGKKDKRTKDLRNEAEVMSTPDAVAVDGAVLKPAKVARGKSAETADTTSPKPKKWPKIEAKSNAAATVERASKPTKQTKSTVTKKVAAKKAAPTTAEASPKKAAGKKATDTKAETSAAVSKPVTAAKPAKAAKATKAAKAVKAVKAIKAAPLKSEKATSKPTVKPVAKAKAIPQKAVKSPKTATKPSASASKSVNEKPAKATAKPAAKKSAAKSAKK